MRIHKAVVPVLSILILAYALLAQAQRAGGPMTMPPTPGTLPAYRFEKIVEGVYFATGTGSMTTGSNKALIVNDEDVLIVDPGITPSSARAFAEDVKTITNKPIRYVVDSHYHYDHAFGNQIFGQDVTLIGHENTRLHLLTNVMQQRTYTTNGTNAIANRFEQLKKQIASATDPQEKAVLERQLAIHQLYADDQRNIKPTPPTTTFARDITLFRGTREIQVRFMGRAHTDGDIIVFLPRERIIATGDMIPNGLTNISYTGDGFIRDWPDTLEQILALDFETVLPGHGAVFKGKEQIRAQQAYWRDFYQQAEALRKQGVTPEEAAKRIDLTKHVASLPAAKNPGVDVRGVDRLYDLAANPNAPVR